MAELLQANRILFVVGQVLRQEVLEKVPNNPIIHHHLGYGLPIEFTGRGERI